MPYFQKQSWPAFVYKGLSYDLTHLNEFQFEITDSQKIIRKIAVTFSDHCFTSKPEVGDDPNLRYLSSTRSPGHFSMQRYENSKNISSIIINMTVRDVWQTAHDNYAIVTTVDDRGNQVDYGIIFSLDKASGLPVDLHMTIRSAHIRDQKALATFGRVRFAHLVKLRMQNKHPKRITNVSHVNRRK